ncbi:MULTISPECIES: SH3-like domain-containing protein [Agrobacterium]|uniref:Nitrile hydratase subunit beta n=1 Tax=Agrobacterium rubi TaxID=28099 RepID=A0AAE7US08_9HYPH|nr:MULTISPECIES: SH3-like domain-containing protein [Agrobacterium]MBN7807827.1 nitrile hydratase subunit beta [Agrobacterium rosae]NTE89787.1 nitrile hydratase subunit beta [Agrobacterium rubi]NTF05363.1 nitrile hydratase subunit beta [Agrobacterium rubi]NTF10481.1 nitrile hydratase subunit beta [Agrobacterium rubi]NTF22875.1 nitrile hydratase subunit beta [Agrobacterium rubi]
MGCYILEEGARTPGDKVTVRHDWPEDAGPCHVRTPAYSRGRDGTIVGLLGSFGNPEDLAFNRPADRKRLYHVRFDMTELWPDSPDKRDTVVIEIYEHWLTDKRED